MLWEHGAAAALMEPLTVMATLEVVEYECLESDSGLVDGGVTREDGNHPPNIVAEMLDMPRWLSTSLWI